MTHPPGHLLVVNGRAGSADDEAVEQARQVLAQAGPVEVAATRDRADLDAALAALGDRRLVVAGGDGSVHLVVSRLRERAQLDAPLDHPLGLVPLGTGNDLARALGVPLEPADAARAVLDGRARRLDLLADDGGGVVVNAAHVGVGADAAAAAGRLKPRLGPLAYPLGALAAGLRATGWRLRVEVDGTVLADTHRRVLMVGVGNGTGIGGGTPLLPRAEPDDGRLDVVVSYATGPLARVRFGAALAAGRHLADPDVRWARGHDVSVTGGPVGVNTDGELGDPVERRSWRVEPGAWSVLVPG